MFMETITFHDPKRVILLILVIAVCYFSVFRQCLKSDRQVTSLRARHIDSCTTRDTITAPGPLRAHKQLPTRGTKNETFVFEKKITVIPLERIR